MALKTKIHQTTGLGYTLGELPVKSLYTVGIAGENFFRTLMAKGELTGARCEQCDYVYVPPRIFCERCFARLTSDVTLSGKGTLRAVTRLYVGPDGSRLKEPRLVGLIALDGASSLFVHFLGEIEEPKVGMRVQMVLKPKKARSGTITDIEYFKPL